MTVLIVALFALTAPVASFAAMDHGTMDMGHGAHQGDVAHEEVVDGVKATFKVMSMKEHMKAMNMEIPKEMKETHHIAVEFKDAKTGKALTEGEVKIKVQNPDKSDHSKDLMGMQGHFGAEHTEISISEIQEGGYVYEKIGCSTYGNGAVWCNAGVC